MITKYGKCAILHTLSVVNNLLYSGFCGILSESCTVIHVILLHRYSVKKCVLPEICSLFMRHMGGLDVNIHFFERRQQF